MRTLFAIVELGDKPLDGKVATVPGRGVFRDTQTLRPNQAAINKSWKPGDIEKMR